MTNHPTWHYLEHLIALVPSWILAIGGAGTLVLSHLESGLTRTAAALVALMMIATVCWRAWKLIGQLIRRTDAVDQVVEVQVPKLIVDVANLHGSLEGLRTAHERDAAELHQGQADIKRSLWEIEERSKRRREGDPP